MKTKLLPLLLFAFSANAFALDTPTEDFIDNNDGTVTHKKTGLTWQRCSVGQTWTGSGCSGTALTMNWDSAMASYGNKTDCNEWRLPRIDELNTITESNTLVPAINTTIFPNTPTDIWFWSASESASYFGDAWFVNFNFSNNNRTGKHINQAVRLMRGGQSCSFDSFTPSSDFIDNNNGTVTHQKTGLMWQRCSIGQTWNGASCTGSALTMSYNSALTQTSTLAGYSDWRLPTLSELKTIVEYKSYSPAINSTLFPNTSTDYFWSASVYAGNSISAWMIGFEYGTDFNTYKSDNYKARLVRGTWSAPTITTPVTPITPTFIDLSSTISTPSPSIQQNANNTYTATATNNGTGTANNVMLKFYMPPRWINYVSLPSDCTFNGTVTVCNLGSLNAGASVSRSITVNFQKRGATSVGAWAGSDETDTNKANNMRRMITTITK